MNLTIQSFRGFYGLFLFFFGFYGVYRGIDYSLIGGNEYFDIIEFILISNILNICMSVHIYNSITNVKYDILSYYILHFCKFMTGIWTIIIFFSENNYPNIISYQWELVFANFIIFWCDICWILLFKILYYCLPNKEELHSYISLELGIYNKTTIPINDSIMIPTEALGISNNDSIIITIETEINEIPNAECAIINNAV
jgi:hypothetical protein